jgi:hypothetical protein
MKWNPRSVAEYLPPPHVVLVATLLESFHPQRSNHLAHQDRLIRREALHFIVVIAVEEDGSERKKGRDRRKGLKAPHPQGLPFIAQMMHYERIWALRSAINSLKGP